MRYTVTNRRRSLVEEKSCFRSYRTVFHFITPCFWSTFIFYTKHFKSKLNTLNEESFFSTKFVFNISANKTILDIYKFGAEKIFFFWISQCYVPTPAHRSIFRSTLIHGQSNSQTSDVGPSFFTCKVLFYFHVDFSTIGRLYKSVFINISIVYSYQGPITELNEMKYTYQKFVSQN